MGRQSSRIYFQGKDHKEIYFQGHYHKAMYIGATKVWEKLKSGIFWKIYKKYPYREKVYEGYHSDRLNKCVAFSDTEILSYEGNRTIDGVTYNVFNKVVKFNKKIEILYQGYTEPIVRCLNSDFYCICDGYVLKNIGDSFEKIETAVFNSNEVIKTVSYRDFSFAVAGQSDTRLFINIDKTKVDDSGLEDNPRNYIGGYYYTEDFTHFYSVGLNVYYSDGLTWLYSNFIAHSDIVKIGIYYYVYGRKLNYYTDPNSYQYEYCLFRTINFSDFEILIDYGTSSPMDYTYVIGKIGYYFVTNTGFTTDFLEFKSFEELIGVSAFSSNGVEYDFTGETLSLKKGSFITDERYTYICLKTGKMTYQNGIFTGNVTKPYVFIVITNDFQIQDIVGAGRITDYETGVTENYVRYLMESMYAEYTYVVKNGSIVRFIGINEGNDHSDQLDIFLEVEV